MRPRTLGWVAGLGSLVALAGGLAVLAASDPRAPSSPATRAIEMRIVSLNAWALPLFSAQLPERLARLPDALRGLAPDVICLQEMWSASARADLAAALGPGFSATTSDGG